MSLQQKILNLISGLPEASMRVDVASAINYIFNLYISGHINEDQARQSLYEISSDVIRFTYADLTEDEVRKKANQLTEEFMRAFKVEATHRRVISRFSPATRLPY